MPGSVVRTDPVGVPERSPSTGWSPGVLRCTTGSDPPARDRPGAGPFRPPAAGERCVPLRCDVRRGPSGV